MYVVVFEHHCSAVTCYTNLWDTFFGWLLELEKKVHRSIIR